MDNTAFDAIVQFAVLTAAYYNKLLEVGVKPAVAIKMTEKFIAVAMTPQSSSSLPSFWTAN